MASSSMASAAPRGFMAAPATASSGPTKFTLISMPCSSNSRNLRLIVRATNEGAPVGEEAILDAEDAAVDSLPAAEAKASPVGPAKGSKVRILRKESYWYKGVGRVVTVDKDPKSRYPVVVRFQKANYANVSSNNYALDEIELVPVP